MGHQKSITCLSISPDGRWIATGSEDNSVKVRKKKLEIRFHY